QGDQSRCQPSSDTPFAGLYQAHGVNVTGQTRTEQDDDKATPSPPWPLGPPAAAARPCRLPDPYLRPVGRPAHRRPVLHNPAHDITVVLHPDAYGPSANLTIESDPN